MNPVPKFGGEICKRMEKGRNLWTIEILGKGEILVDSLSAFPPSHASARTVLESICPGFSV